MEQLQLQAAREAGEGGMAQSLAAASRRDPLFSAKAQEAILRHLAACPGYQCSGEELVEVAKAHGAVPPDARAFGSVFQGLARRNQIRCLRSDLPRKHGHGTSGGRLWGLVQ